ncbi:MAG: hypothetical protein WD512_16650 [Candidatus Paceibacterota bacterium]
MANIKKINELQAGSNPAPTNLLAVYNINNGLTEKLTIDQILNTIDSSFRYDPNKAGGYDTGEIVTFGTPSQLFESLVDGNETTPQDDGVNWQLISASDSSSVLWTAGVYTKASIKVFGNSIYLLPSTITFPYNSVNDPKTDNNWINLFYPKQQSGNEISFEKPNDYGTDLLPLSGALTDTNLGAEKGNPQKIYHQDTTLPVPSSWVRMGATEYESGALNLIVVEWERNDRKIYWIAQEA